MSIIIGRRRPTPVTKDFAWLLANKYIGVFAAQNGNVSIDSFIAQNRVFNIGAVVSFINKGGSMSLYISGSAYINESGGPTSGSNSLYALNLGRNTGVAVSGYLQTYAPSICKIILYDANFFSVVQGINFNTDSLVYSGSVSKNIIGLAAVMHPSSSAYNCTNNALYNEGSGLVNMQSNSDNCYSTSGSSGRRFWIPKIDTINTEGSVVLRSAIAGTPIVGAKICLLSNLH